MNHYTIFYMNAGKECQLKRTEKVSDGSEILGFKIFCAYAGKDGIFINDRIWISPAAIVMITYEWIPA